MTPTTSELHTLRIHALEARQAALNRFLEQLVLLKGFALERALLSIRLLEIEAELTYLRSL